MLNGPLLFLSHSGIDSAEARELKRRIEASPSAKRAGLKVWFDKDDLAAGMPWQQQLGQIITEGCTAFAVYVGSKGVMNWVESEVSLGLSRATTDKSFPFIPILAQKSMASALPPFAALYQAVRDPLNDPAEMEKFLKAILEPRGPVVILDEPFVGLRAMTEADAARFFGRTAEINELVKKLENSRLVAVVADSGSGKSSLVQAGLIPKFRGGVFAENAREELAGRIWHVVTMRPGSAPFDQLRRAVTAAAERLARSPKEKAELGELIDPSKPQQTAYALQCNLPTEATETLLVIDQFEELFTQTPEHLRAPFIDWVLSLIAPGAVLGFRVILTIRSDYFNLCSTHPPLFALLKQDNVTYRLKQITDEGLAEVVRKPLLMAGHKDSAEQDALVALIRRDVSDRPGDLALVQMALFETWKQHKLNRLGLLEAYTEVGGVSGALAHAAEDVRTNKLDATQQDLLEPVFVRLINLGSTAGATRRIARTAEFDDSRRDLIKLLSEEKYSRLLLLGTETVDICHEQLITQWPWLQTRINESAIDVRRLGLLIDKASLWNEIGDTNKNQYLATGAELEVFDDLATRHHDWLSPIETDYVKTSKKIQQHAERWSAWLFRTAVAASVLFAASAVIALLFYQSATRQTQIAQEQTRTAIANESRALTALSRVAFEDGRPNQAAQLALAAWPRDERDQHPRLETTLQSLSRAVSVGKLYTHKWQHNGPVLGALLTKDETRILSWSEDNTLRLWDVATARQIGPAIKHDDRVNGALLTKDERRILSWSDDHTLRLWDVATGQQIGPAMKHDGSVNGALLTNDETRIVSWSDDNTLRLWDVATGRQIAPAMKHDEVVRGALLTKNETRILSWSNDDTLRLWNIATGQQIGAAMKHDEPVSGALLTKDESRILSWSADDTSRLWNVATGQQIGAAMKHDEPVSGALLTNDETRIVSWSDDNTLRLWDIATGQQIGPAMKHDEPVSGALLTKDETRILSWSADDHTLHLWDVATGQQIGPAMKHDGTVWGALLTKDGTRILSWSDDHTLRLWDVATGRQIGPTMEHDGPVFGALLTEDESRILSWSNDHTLRLWDVATGQQIGPAMKHYDWVRGARLTKDETRILSWSRDLQLWDVATGRQIGPAMKHDEVVRGALLTKNETRILSWSNDHTLRLWDLATGQQIGPAMKHDGSVRGALLTKDERRILSWSDDSTLRLWDVATGQQIGPAMKHDELVVGVLLTKDQTRVLSWSQDTTLRLWDVATARQIGPAMKHDDRANGALLTKDEARVLSWSDDNTLRLWDVATGQQIGPDMKHDERVEGARLTKNETRILSWSFDGTLRLWDVATGQQIGSPMKHDNRVNGALLTKDETRILSWSFDHTLRLWDVATGQQIGPAMKHDGSVRGALLTKDETRVLSWSDDHTLRLWDVATGQQIGPAMKHDNWVMGALLTKDETRILSWSRDHTLRVWDAGWPKGNLLEVACALLPIEDRDASAISKDYGVTLKDPICSSPEATIVPTWSSIERALDPMFAE